MKEPKSITVRIKGHDVILDLEDWALLKRFTWGISKNRKSLYVVGTFYLSGARRNLAMHRFITGFSKKVVDHINRNTLDNRKSNLRFANYKQSAWNREYNNATGYIGVQQYKDEFSMRIKIGKERRLLTGFKTAEAAARAYDDFAFKHRKEFARLNFPEDFPKEGVK